MSACILASGAYYLSSCKSLIVESSNRSFAFSRYIEKNHDIPYITPYQSANLFDEVAAWIPEVLHTAVTSDYAERNPTQDVLIHKRGSKVGYLLRIGTKYHIDVTIVRLLDNGEYLEQSLGLVEDAKVWVKLVNNVNG